MNAERFLAVVFAVALLGAGCDSSTSVVATSSGQIAVNAPAPAATTTQPVIETKKDVTAPISNALERVTKKPLGQYVTPKNSPVSPEIFSGYHTGTDFETTPEEQDADVVISTICSGSVLLKKWVTGYGGVVVQKCQIDGKTVTVLYGHLKLASVPVKVGQQLSQGEKLGVLGKGYSTETSGERKHLHLGIHKGSAVNLAGYVQAKSSLSQWLDVRTFIH